MVGTIGLILAIVILIIGTFRRVGVIPMTIISALIVIFTSGLELWPALSTYYAPGFAGAYSSFFLIFASSCVYSKIMELSGSATMIAYKIIDWVGKKNVVTACCIAGAVLVYGGVNGFVIAYVMVPIMFMLYKEANVHRRYMMCPIMVACGTFTMGFLPASTQLSNVIPSQYLGTSLSSAPVLGILASAALLTMQLLYINHAVKKSQARGEQFTFPANVNASSYTEVSRDELPPVWVAFAPIVVMMALVIFGGSLIKNSSALTVAAIVIGGAVGFALNFKRLVKLNPKAFITEGMTNGVIAISGLAAVSGMAAVFQHSPSYSQMVNWIMAADMNPYVKGALAGVVGSAMAGSSSASLKVLFESLGDYFLTCGASLPILHRIIAMCSLPFSNLPNCAGHYIHLNLIGMTQADCYKDTFVINVLLGAAVCAVSLVIVVIAY